MGTFISVHEHRCVCSNTCPQAHGAAHTLCMACAHARAHSHTRVYALPNNVGACAPAHPSHAWSPSRGLALMSTMSILLLLTSSSGLPWVKCSSLPDLVFSSVQGAPPPLTHQRLGPYRTGHSPDNARGSRRAHVSPRDTRPGAAPQPVHPGSAENAPKLLSFPSALSITERTSSVVQHRTFWQGSPGWLRAYSSGSGSVLVNFSSITC